MEYLLRIDDLNHNCSQTSTQALENGQVLFLPNNGFQLKPEEHIILNPELLAPKEKNISYLKHSKKLSGLNSKIKDSEWAFHTAAMMDRYADYATSLIHKLMPEYQDYLSLGRTSYRPAEIKNRKTSALKDDTRLHVDAFYTTPVQGHRILRVFANINPKQEDRVWNLGEAFSDVLTRFNHRLSDYKPWQAKLMHLLGLTKSLRSRYDHLMLQLHDSMKLDLDYQTQVSKKTFAFPSASTWLVYTDLVSHAALSGQHLLEQTFYIPVEGMHTPALSPLHQLKALRPDLSLV